MKRILVYGGIYFGAPNVRRRACFLVFAMVVILSVFVPAWLVVCSFLLVCLSVCWFLYVCFTWCCALVFYGFLLVFVFALWLVDFRLGAQRIDVLS